MSLFEWQFSPKAKASIRQSTARLNIWHGAVRSGKTVSSVIAWVRFINSAPRGDLLMVGKTERTLRRNILDLLEQIVGGRNYHYNKGEGEVYVYGRKIYVVGANDERAEQKIRGMTLAGAYGDEVTLWPESFFTQLLARMSVKGARLMGTTNPDGPFHWLKRNYLDRGDELGLRDFHFGLADNPALDPEYIRSLKLEYGEGTLWYKRFIDGLWVQAEGAVYDFFNESEHVLKALPETAPDFIDLSCDYGTSNATSVGQYHSWGKPLDGGLVAVRARAYYYSGRDSGRQKTDSEFADDIEKHFADVKPRHRYFILDPSAASFKAELRKRGWRVREAVNEVVDGIRTQARMLKSGAYRIGPDASNKQCVRDYGAYLWDSKAQDRGEDKPLKQNDHTKDEERYYLHTLHREGTTMRVTSKPKGW